MFDRGMSIYSKVSAEDDITLITEARFEEWAEVSVALDNSDDM